MQIEYKNSRIKKVCTDAYEAEKKHGKEMAEKIHMRIDQISAALSVEMMIQYRIGKMCIRDRSHSNRHYQVSGAAHEGERGKSQLCLRWYSRSNH